MTVYDPNSVEYRGDLRRSLEERYRLVDALEGGVGSMLRGGIDFGPSYLEKLPKEDSDTYDLRCQLAELESVYSDTLTKLAGKPFSQPITFENVDNLDPRLADLESDVDGEGTDITSWGKNVFRESMHRGVSFVLIDMPEAPADAPTVAGKLNRATELQVMRPRWIHVSPLDLIGWREAERDPNSPPQLEQVRLLTSRVEADGAYGEKIFDVLRVISQDTFEVWERERPRQHTDGMTRSGQLPIQGVSETFVQVASGTHTFGEVPLYPFYTRRIGPFLGQPALQELGDANLGHFRALSAHNLLLEHARRNLLFGAGFREDELGAIRWSSSTSIITTNHEAKLETVGYQGTAHEASFQDLERRARRMRSLGAAPMEPRSANTATEVLSDENGTTTSLQAWAVRFGRFIGQLVERSNEMVGNTAPLPDDFRAKVYDDFALNIDSATDGQLLLTARESGELSQETFLGEYKRRGIISDGVDIEAEITRTDAEKQEAAEQADMLMEREATLAAGDTGDNDDDNDSNDMEN